MKLNPEEITFSDPITKLNLMHLAASEGNLKIVEILLNHNFPIDTRTLDNKTPLHISTEKGFFDITKLLLDSGANLNLLDNDKHTPLHLACLNNHYELVNYLLEKCPQITGKDRFGKSPYDLANDKTKKLLESYLEKNNPEFHKIKIHTFDTNKKQINININTNIGNINSLISQVNLSHKKPSVKQPITNTVTTSIKSIQTTVTNKLNSILSGKSKLLLKTQLETSPTTTIKC